MRIQLPAFRGAIFDLDGTLLESMHVWEEVDREFLTRRHLPVEDDYMEQVATMGFRLAAEHTIAHFGLSETPEDIMAEWSGMVVEAYTHHVQLKPGADAYLRQLKEQGVRLAVATASDESLFVPTLERTGVLSLFDCFTTVGEVRKSKDFPDVYLRAAEKLGLSPAHCVVFEDVPAAIRSAKAGGFFTVGLCSPGTGDRIRECADVAIAGYADLLE